ncbi:hypothetical protein [Nonomuraea lactucae]|nr:hypothetical protein [Nonomuraea lactucae]
MCDGLWLRNFPWQDLPRYSEPVDEPDETSGRVTGWVDETN